jgi:hypothetical protein
MVLFAKMCTKRGEWTRTIDKTKAAHWKAILDTPSSGYLWMATAYMELNHKYANLPLLKAGDRKAVEIDENVQVLRGGALVSGSCLRA